MQVAPTSGQIYNLCKWLHLVAKFTTYANFATWWANLEVLQAAPLVAKVITDISGATWWANFQQIQVATHGGQIYNKCKWRHLVANLATSTSGATR